MTRWWVVALALLAGPVRAGDAWVGDYRIHDAHGDRALVLIRDDTRIEYRVEGEPTRVWRRMADGIELRELHPRDHRMIVYSPGDLRTLDRVPNWTRLSALVDPTLRTRLTMAGEAPAFGQNALQYRGTDAQHNPVELDWLDAAAMPVRLSVARKRDGKQRHGDAIHGDVIHLRRLQRVPAAQAFTGLDGLLEIDVADLGDMELDPFVRSLSRADR